MHKPIDKTLITEGKKREYAFVMVKYEVPKLINEIQDEIPDDILYTDKDIPDYYGKEKTHHITVAACLDNDVNLEEIKKILKPLPQYTAYLKGVSSFANPEFDVVKCDVVSKELTDTNKAIYNKFESHSSYKDSYHPHLTLAYVQKGQGSAYDRTFNRLIEIKPIAFLFSYVDNGEEKQIEFEK